MDYQQAAQLRKLLAEAYLIRPRNLVFSFGLEQTGQVEALTADQRTIIGVGTIQRNPDEYAIRVFTQTPDPAFDRNALAEQLGVRMQDLDIIVTEGIDAFNTPVRTRARPAPLGCSIGLDAAGTGTFGGLVRDATNTYILSNNHVLADANRAALGSAILQPGTVDGGTTADRIAQLSRFVPIDFTGRNRVDAAIAQIDNLDDVINALPSSIPFIGSIRGITAPTNKMVVAKYGRTTGLTLGVIESLDFDVNVRVGGGLASFDDQLQIKGQNGPFSMPGDSGSVIIDVESKRAVGLLFAGDAQTGDTFANPISNVLSALGVTFV